MSLWQKLDERIQQVGHRVLVMKKYRLPSGVEWDFTTYGPVGAATVGVIALTTDNQVVIARQFRPGPEVVLDEIPGGDAEPGESLQAAAERELLEETGYKPASMEFLGKAYRDAYSNVTSHYFLARGCEAVSSQSLDTAEAIEVVKISPTQLIDNARNSRLSDAAAVFLAYDSLQDMV